MKYFITLALIAALTVGVLAGCKTTKRTFDPATGQLISEEEVYDVQTTMLFMQAAIDGADRLATLYKEIEATQDANKKAELQAKADREKARLELASKTAERLLPMLTDNTELRGRIEQIIATYTKPGVAAQAGKEAVKEEAKQAEAEASPK